MRLLHFTCLRQGEWRFICFIHSLEHLLLFVWSSITLFDDATWHHLLHITSHFHEWRSDTYPTFLLPIDQHYHRCTILGYKRNASNLLSLYIILPFNWINIYHRKIIQDNTRQQRCRESHRSHPRFTALERTTKRTISTSSPIDPGKVIILLNELLSYMCYMHT